MLGNDNAFSNCQLEKINLGPLNQNNGFVFQTCSKGVILTTTRWEFASKASERPTHS